MTIAQIWIIESMQSYPEAEGVTDVVFNVNWRLNGTDGTHFATVYSSQGVTYVAGTPYTPYADLTEATVIGWVQSAMGEETVAAHEANINTQIANQINPPVVTLPNPWNA